MQPVIIKFVHFPIGFNEETKKTIGNFENEKLSNSKWNTTTVEECHIIKE